MTRLASTIYAQSNMIGGNTTGGNMTGGASTVGGDGGDGDNGDNGDDVTEKKIRTGSN